MEHKRSHKTSWQQVSSWYDAKLGSKGDYYHKHVVIPGTVRLLKLRGDSSLLDVGCGQGVLERSVPRTITYTGFDISPALVRTAAERAKNPNHTFLVIDAGRSFPQTVGMFTHAAVVLALQNMSDPAAVIKNIAPHLNPQGVLVLTLNHPYFRIPRFSGWDTDPVNKIQKRWVSAYMTPTEIPVSMHPGQGKNSSVSWSYHHPLSDYVSYLSDNGFLVERIEEWTSGKESTGPAAKMENRGRGEIPLFMGIRAVKIR